MAALRRCNDVRHARLIPLRGEGQLLSANREAWVTAGVLHNRSLLGKDRSNSSGKGLIKDFDRALPRESY